MKNSTISLLSLLITITFSTQSVSAQSLVGKWKGEDNGEVTPHTVDFIIKMDDGQIEVARMEGIYNLLDKKTLVINMKFDGTDRPTALDDDSEDQITLKKMKK